MSVLRDKVLGTAGMFSTISSSLVHSGLEQTQLARGNTFLLCPQCGFGCYLELFNGLFKLVRVLEPIFFLSI